MVLHKLRISSANYGVRKMLVLIIKNEESIKKKVLEAYQEIYFNNNMPFEIQALYLIDLTVGLNYSEIYCLRELLKLLITNKSINFNIFKEIWKIFLRDPEAEMEKSMVTSLEEKKLKYKMLKCESRAALQILNLSAEYDNAILINHSELFTKFVYRYVTKKETDWIIIKECLLAIQKIFTMKKDLAENCLLKICKLVLAGYGSQDTAWYQAMQELIITIFLINSSPEKISHYLIVKMCKPIFVNHQSSSETQSAFLTQNIESAPKFTQSNLPSDENLDNMNININDNFAGINSKNILIIFSYSVKPTYIYCRACCIKYTCLY